RDRPPTRGAGGARLRCRAGLSVRPARAGRRRRRPDRPLGARPARAPAELNPARPAGRRLSRWSRRAGAVDERILAARAGLRPALGSVAAATKEDRWLSRTPSPRPT